MKVTKNYLKQVIKEELQKVVNENTDYKNVLDTWLNYHRQYLSNPKLAKVAEQNGHYLAKAQEALNNNDISTMWKMIEKYKLATHH